MTPRRIQLARISGRKTTAKDSRDGQEICIIPFHFEETYLMQVEWAINIIIDHFIIKERVRALTKPTSDHEVKDANPSS